MPNVCRSGAQRWGNPNARAALCKDNHTSECERWAALRGWINWWWHYGSRTLETKRRQGAFSTLQMDGFTMNEHTHTWLVDNLNVGTCECGEVKAFTPNDSNSNWGAPRWEARRAAASIAETQEAVNVAVNSQDWAGGWR